MAQLTPRKPADSYYDRFPESTHAPGDIWMHLPTHGLLHRKYCSGLVVTPSCDLLNRKVHTVTYVPIIPFRDWVGSRDFVPEVIHTMSSLVDQLGPIGISSRSALEEHETFGSELSKRWLALRRRLAEGDLNKSLRTAAERYVACCNHLKRVSRGKPADHTDLETCLTKNRWQQIRTQIVRNAFRTDLYFLPAVDNDLGLSPIPNNSVALFRYALTVPLSLLDAAQDTSLTDWRHAARSLADEEPMARAFSRVRPLKCLRLQSRFLPDLLTKFVALYSRLGSPDFTPDTVETLSNELGAWK
jgi:hypothetical protein